MFRFTLQGRIGRIQELQKNTLRISLAADRLVEGRGGQWTATEWLSCVSFDAALNTQMLTELEKGQSVTLDGRIVPRVREVDGKRIYDHTFEITRFQRHSKPKAPKAKAAAPVEPAEAAA